MPLDLTPFTVPLRRTPPVLRCVVSGRPDHWLDCRYAVDVFSPREAVAHLVICERESWVMRLRRILEPDRTFPENLNGEVRAAQLSSTTPVQQLLEEFEVLREIRVAELEGLGLVAEDLERSAASPDLGPCTGLEFLNMCVAHDLYHLGQIFKSYSAQFVGQIGPYQEFLNLPHFN